MKNKKFDTNLRKTNKTYNKDDDYNKIKLWYQTTNKTNNSTKSISLIFNGTNHYDLLEYKVSLMWLILVYFYLNYLIIVFLFNLYSFSILIVDY